MILAYAVVNDEWTPGSTVDGYRGVRDPENPEVGLIHVTHPSAFDEIDGWDIPGTETFATVPSWFKSDPKSREVIEGIKRDGMILNPVPVNVGTGMIQDGHHRVLAGREAGIPIPWYSVTGEGKDHAALFAHDLFKPFEEQGIG